MANLESLEQQDNELQEKIDTLIEKQSQIKKNIDKISVLNKNSDNVKSMSHRSNKMLESKMEQVDYAKHKFYSLILFIGMLVLVILVLVFSSFKPQSFFKSTFSELKKVVNA